MNNSWGSGMAVDETLAMRMIRRLRTSLAWRCSIWTRAGFAVSATGIRTRKNSRTGSARIADEAHQHGLKFGLWVDWTQAGLDTEPGALNVARSQSRDWLVADVPADWKPADFKGRTIDLGVPARREYGAA